MDFIVELLELSEYNTIMIVINSISKRIYFILTHTTVTIEGIIRLFLHYV